MTLDPRHKIVGVEMRQALVASIRDADSSVSEKVWVEWKTHVELTVKVWHAEIAKQIVGFANRMPDTAARHADGHAYLVLGVEPGVVDGVVPVEDLQLVRDLRPYLGQDGPSWDAAYVEIDSKHVLVVEVMPPRWGDPVFQIRKEFPPTVREGPYVRGVGETAIATAAELDRLVERAKRSAVRVAVSVTWADGEQSIDPVGLDEGAVDRWIDKERDRLDPRTVNVASVLGESRQRGTFESELDLYLRKARKLIRGKAALHAMWAKAGAARLRVMNLSDRHLKDVRVEVELPAETTGALDARDEENLLDFPKAPRPYGTGVTLFSDFAAGIRGAHWTPPPPLGWVDTAHRVVTFAEKDLFAEDWIILPTLHIFADGRVAGERLELRWSARAANVDGVVRGTLTFSVSTKVRELDAVMSVDRLSAYRAEREAPEE